MKNPNRLIVSSDIGLMQCLSAISAAYNKMPDKKSLEVEFGEYVKTRQDAANRYLHGWIFRKQLMAKLNDSGQGITDPVTRRYYEWDVDMLKDYFKDSYFRDQVILISPILIRDTKGKIKEIQREFKPSALESDKFWKYCEVIKDYSANRWNITIDQHDNGYWQSVYNELRG